MYGFLAINKIIRHYLTQSFNIIKRLMQLLTNNYNHIERLLSTPLSHDGDTLKMGANRVASSDGYWEKICKFVV